MLLTLKFVLDVGSAYQVELFTGFPGCLLHSAYLTAFRLTMVARSILEGTMVSLN